jgi:membrane associated rhomboid family serine protease
MPSRIATESKRQAMDWSLALVSQGIESIIDQGEETDWGLIVDENDFAHALEVIKQYQLENLRWPWQQKIFQQQISFDWGSLAWVCLMFLFFWLSERSENFREAGMMNSGAVSRGEWWRLFTAISLHADAGHLASNAGIGFVLLGLTMGRFGTGVGLLAAYVAGTGGNVASWLVSQHGHQSLGASGMVMGCLGLLAAQSVPLLKRDAKSLKSVLAGLAGGLMLFVLMGLSPGTDVAAHFGGFLAGVFLGTLLTFVPRLGRNASANIFAGAVFSVLVILPWWLASCAKR